MAASDWIAGYELTVTIQGVQYPFARVSYRPSAKMINRSNSKYFPGYVINKAGLRSLTFTASGPFKEGELPIGIGYEYTWIYKPSGANVGFSFLGVVESITHANDVEDGPTTEVTVQSTDQFGVLIG